jgi:hypothetical protein
VNSPWLIYFDFFLPLTPTVNNTRGTVIQK